MVLKRTEKQHLVADLTEKLRGAPAAVVTSFRALTMADSSALRKTLRASGGRVQVVPKRLFRRIAEVLGWPVSFGETRDSLLVAWTEGPAKLHSTAEALAKAGRSGGTDLEAPVKTLHAYLKRHEDAKFLGGVLRGNPLTGAEVTQLATLPSRELLRAQVVGLLAHPLHGLVGICVGVLRGLPAVLGAKIRA